MLLSNDPETVNHPYTSTPAEAGPSDASADATATALASQGNPLCNAARFVGSCYPDDPTGASGCGPEADGGTYAATATLACHVTVVDGGSADAGAVVQPMCSVSGVGANGAPCAMSTDCAATNECVGTGTCERYCCEGDSVCPYNEYCGIQPLVDAPGTKVPVCMPIRPCGLLDQASDAGACPATETCAVVRDENGTTGCVPVGPARAGEDCETEYCARGLVCIGTWGRHACYALCHIANPIECSSGQACTWSPALFVDTAIGVCE